MKKGLGLGAVLMSGVILLTGCSGKVSDIQSEVSTFKEKLIRNEVFDGDFKVTKIVTDIDGVNTTIDETTLIVDGDNINLITGIPMGNIKDEGAAGENKNEKYVIDNKKFYHTTSTNTVGEKVATNIYNNDFNNYLDFKKKVNDIKKSKVDYFVNLLLDYSVNDIPNLLKRATDSNSSIEKKGFTSKKVTFNISLLDSRKEGETTIGIVKTNQFVFSKGLPISFKISNDEGTIKKIIEYKFDFSNQTINLPNLDSYQLESTKGGNK